MDPGALIPDIGHLEEVLVDTCISHRFLKQGLMGLRRAGANNDPVELVLLDCLGDSLLGILRATKEILLHIFNKGQAPCIPGNSWNIHYPCYIGAALAYKDPDPWPLTLDGRVGYLRRELLFLGTTESGL